MFVHFVYNPLDTRSHSYACLYFHVLTWKKISTRLTSKSFLNKVLAGNWFFHKTNRLSYELYKGYRSFKIEVFSGVLQGSILGPVLLPLFIKAIASVIYCYCFSHCSFVQCIYFLQMT